MNMRTVLNVLLVILLATSMGCHKYGMRGSVLDVSDGTAFLCIGTEEGAKVGQEFTVYRYIRTATSPKGERPHALYRVETVGRVQITNTESHMANAKILTGDVKANDVVVLDE